MEIVSLGDSALVIRVRESFDAAPRETLDAVLETQRRLENAQLPGVIEVAPAYTTVAVFFNPICVVKAGAPVENVFDWLVEKIREALAAVPGVDEAGRAQYNSGPAIEIPVCYETEFAPDLEDVSR